MSAPRVVAFGGGHGLSASLRALRRVTEQLTAVVTVADDGGSSGRLRDEFHILPPGDLRMALAALCADDEEGRRWASVLQSRFHGDGPLAGHAVGNLLIAGAWQQLGDEVAALEMVGSLLGVRGRVLPMSAVPLEIEADVIGLDPLAPDELHTLTGQATIAKAWAEVRAVRIIPADPPAHPKTLEAISDAQVLVFGPGSWFTSVLPHLLVPQLRSAIIASPAQRILVMNAAPADETSGFSPSRHIETLVEHAPDIRFDVVLADTRFAAADHGLRAAVHEVGAELLVADVTAHDASATHDTERLAAAFTQLIARERN